MIISNIDIIFIGNGDLLFILYILSSNINYIKLYFSFLFFIGINRLQSQLYILLPLCISFIFSYNYKC